jgi:6-phosphogluconolactonase (cycloisomerase 2 family)
MIITRDGNYLIVCNQNSHNVSFFKLDKESGALKQQISEISFITPSGILELA